MIDRFAAAVISILALVLVENVGALRTSFLLTTPPSTLTPCFHSRQSDLWKLGASDTNLSDDDDDVNLNQEESNKRRIDIVSSVELPFSAEIAFQAYSDLTRQPSWSSWLHSVEYDPSTEGASIWTMKAMGVKYSWTAVSTAMEPPNVIAWKSTSGLQNFGRVEFHSTSPDTTIMNLQMMFLAPRAVSALFRKSNKLAKFAEQHMIRASLEEFREVVLQNDVPKMEGKDNQRMVEQS
jgi:uncharacterized membrane protein